MDKLDFCVRSLEDLTSAVIRCGVLPLFRNSIPGFSVEEHTDPSCWYTAGSGEWKVWDWKGPVIRETGCAYGKFFEKKAAFVSRELFSDLANYRRDGYDMDARYDDGLASRKDLELYELIAGNEPILSGTLKVLGDYRKGGNTGFDTSMNRLQSQCYVLISDFIYSLDRHGRRYGWGSAEYSTPERFMGSYFSDSVYSRSPSASGERLLEHMRQLFPGIGEKNLLKFIDS